VETNDIFAKLDEIVAGEKRDARAHAEAAAPAVPSDTPTEGPGPTQRISNLELALEHRTVIGQATGIVMERYGIDAAAAFSVLARISSHTNRKIYVIAGELVEKRQMPGL